MNHYRICFSTPRGERWITIKAINEKVAKIMANPSSRKGWFVKQIVLSDFKSREIV